MIAGVLNGASLAELAAAAAVPMWLRKLPPQAFTRHIGTLPDGELFRRRIANHLPASAKLAPTWLRAVADAAEWGDEATAIWVARELVRDAKAVNLGALRVACLFAWFSARPGTRAHGLIKQPWRPCLRFEATVTRASAWRTRIDLHLNLGDEPIADMWVSPGSFGGYEFVAIRSAEQVSEEASVMRNCLAGYGRSLAGNGTRLFSVRQGGKRVAVIELMCLGSDPLLNITEISGPRNKPVSVEVSQAARRWLHANDLSKATANSNCGSPPYLRPIWMSLWRPYWLAKGRIPHWLPLQPSRDALADLWRPTRRRRRNVGRR